MLRRILLTIVIPVCALGTGCAGERGPAMPFDPDRIVLSEAAAELTRERKATAALAGSEGARDAELICERRREPGTHLMQTYCYTRDEWRRRRAGDD